MSVRLLARVFMQVAGFVWQNLLFAEAYKPVVSAVELAVKAGLVAAEEVGIPADGLKGVRAAEGWGSLHVELFIMLLRDAECFKGDNAHFAPTCEDHLLDQHFFTGG